MQSTGGRSAKERSASEAEGDWIPGGKLTGGVVGILLSGGAGGELLEIHGVDGLATKRRKPQRRSMTSPSLSPRIWGRDQDAQRQRQARPRARSSRWGQVGNRKGCRPELISTEVQAH